MLLFIIKIALLFLNLKKFEKKIVERKQNILGKIQLSKMQKLKSEYLFQVEWC